MIIDSSVLFAILQNEPEARLFIDKIAASQLRIMGAPTYLEACIVAETNKFIGGISKLDDLIFLLEIKVIDFQYQHAQAARVAFLKYGKGQGHMAQLNFGDCMCYAMSKVEAMPLLFKGNNFSKTDVARVI